jgi:hypothetical protein
MGGLEIGPPRARDNGLFSVFVVVLIVIRCFFDDVQLNGIEPYYLEFNPAFVTRDYFTLVGIGVNVHIGIAFGTYSGRHFV